ncbi:homoserine kinase [Nevskia sp.]|uniref:homoserine kinase n=1 Tax=Nevskia sp. TaxID=1929292 RepID=UPI0025F0080F|nr:homoserine kinase [Nevskia sp.]
MSVFTKVSHAELEAFLAQYDLGTLIGYTGIGEGIENTNYFVDTRRGRWVLTLFERLNYDDLPFFLGLMEHLARHGYASALPVADNSGATLSSLNGKPAALVARLTGQSVLFPSLAQCAAVGHALGELHKLSASYSGICENSRGAEWRRATGETLLPKIPEDARSLIADELAAQAQLDLASLPQGVIHADLFKDNVLFVDERLTGVIDFYYACNDALLYDLAVTLNDWCAEADGSLNKAHSAALLSAYRACRPPNETEKAAWPLVLRAAAFRFYLSRLYDWTFPREGDLVHIKDPEPYRRILVHHRSQAVPGL